MSPVELDVGWNPKSALDVLTKPETHVKGLQDFRLVSKESLANSKFSYKVCTAEQSAYSTRKYKSPEYKIGDKVWNNKSLFTDAYARSQQSKKLTDKWFGLFVIKDLIGRNAIRLDLPDYFKIHLVVHVICGIIPLCPGLGERRRCQRGSMRRRRAALIYPIRANSRKGRGSLAGYAKSHRGA